MAHDVIFQPMFNFFCENVTRQKNFYAELVGWEEIKEASTSIYAVLTQNGVQIAFNGTAAYPLLNLGKRQLKSRNDFPIGTMLTFVVDDPAIVNSIARRLPELGGKIVKEPFPTYYGHWQLVFQDPEGNIARITATKLPDGETAPHLDL
ncbi:MAG: VOC family protein [Afipia felis]|nr:VOC family protein [Afipia felis]